MTNIPVLLLFLSITFRLSLSSRFDCELADWTTSFKLEGWSSCESYIDYTNFYINGLRRSGNGNDDIRKLEKARCCMAPDAYDVDSSQCLVADWFTALDRGSRQVSCPPGYYLQGLQRSGAGNRLSNIEFGECCKPARHPRYHGDCYMEDVSNTFNKAGTSKCRNGYYMAGFEKGEGQLLRDIKKFKCCKMETNVPNLESADGVKTRVLDQTQFALANLAHMLGYGWALSCRAQFIGEDFIRRGDSLEADKKPPCVGQKNDERLKIHYKDFKLVTKDITYGEPVLHTLEPQEFYSGTIVNNDPHSVKKTISRSTKTVRSVTHTATSNWEASHTLGVEINYTPPLIPGLSGKVNYQFGYKHGGASSQTDNTQDEKTLTTTVEKTIGAHKSVNWKVMVSKTRTTIPYTATIICDFTAELDGFLRYGGGYNGESTNYHNDYRGSNALPTVKYAFGNADLPFYKDLKLQVSQSRLPWQWYDMKDRYPVAQKFIDDLVQEGQYEFTLSGKFEDIVGTKSDVVFEEATDAKKRHKTPKRSNSKKSDAPKNSDAPIVFRPQPGDPPPVNPAPPVVEIKLPNEGKLPRILASEAFEEESSGSGDDGDDVKE